MKIKKKLIVVIGPTCSKKNLLIKNLSKFFNFSIINADAFQVYKEINIGINKPSDQDLQSIDHYFINNISYNEQWDISIFKSEFDKVYNKIINQNKIPILCGGSHLYIDAIVSGYHFTKYDLTSTIINLDNKYTNEQLFKIIQELDFEYSKKISVNNRRRLLRSVAIMQTENNTMSNIALSNSSNYESFIIMTNKPREQLYSDINKRVDEMFLKGWTNEVIDLINNYENIYNSQAFKAIGYKYIYDCISNKTEINKDVIKQKTRNLAKTQLTWCKNKFLNKYIFDWTKSDINDLVKQINKFLNQ